MNTNKPPIWLLIDGTHHVYRDLHAAGDFTAKLLRPRIHALFDKFQPSRIVAAFDCGETFRSRLFPAYKGERKRPEHIDAALANARLIYQLEGVDVVESPDFEADDVIATIAQLGRRSGHRIVIASADKDLHQLILDGEVNQMISMRRSGDRLDCGFVTAKDLEVSYRVTPAQWVDYRCLIGDKSDNITGVPGIGGNRAAEIMITVGSLNQYYAKPFNFAGISEGMHAKLANAKPRMPLLRKLLTLRTDAPLPEGWIDEAA